MNRMKSLDILRGITVAAMVMVNNSGGHGSFHPMQHSVWNGLTLCDMVFPTFLFVVGVSTYLSLGKLGFAFSAQTFMKIVRRSVLIMLVGWGIHYLDHAIYGNFRPWGGTSSHRCASPNSTVLFLHVHFGNNLWKTFRLCDNHNSSCRIWCFAGVG